MKLVGHRGLPQTFPENSLTGFAAAIEAGAEGIECDVQFNRQGEAFVVHDETLERVSGDALSIEVLDGEQLQKISVHEPERLGDQHVPTPLPLLADLVKLLAQHPDVKVFVELKAESFAWLSRERVVSKTLSVLKGLETQAIIISFDYDILEQVKAASTFPIGWVLENRDLPSLSAARALAPDYLASDYRLWQDELPWPGKWQWFVYDVMSATHARELESRGVEWMESWDVASLRAELDQ